MQQNGYAKQKQAVKLESNMTNATVYSKQAMQSKHPKISKAKRMRIASKQHKTNLLKYRKLHNETAKQNTHAKIHQAKQ